jgi:hypothetical protein
MILIGILCWAPVPNMIDVTEPMALVPDPNVITSKS